jgi:Protein of unknown function (DUF4031)
MTVYVDDMRAPYRGMIMCHMMADTLAELHAMADRIGVERRWFQDSNSGPHYDLPLHIRALAVAAGAREITLKQMAAMAWNRRTTGTMGDPETAIAVMRAARRAERMATAPGAAVALDGGS